MDWMKIRAWDDVAKRMSYGKIEQFDDMLGFRFDHFETEKPVYMRWTGLVDKNGREVYEGDIVRLIERGYSNVNDIDYFDQWLVNENVVSHTIDEDGYIDYEYSLKTDTVVLDRFPRYWLQNETFGYEGEDLVDPDNCEVIGNIHANPDLLKE